MTTYYVSGSGSNTSPYDTWAKAATDIATVQAVPVVSGDVVYVDSTYTKSYSSNTTIDSNAGTYISATYNSSPPTYARGAEFNNSSGYILCSEALGTVYYGFDFVCQSGGMLPASTGGACFFHDCTFSMTSGATAQYPTNVHAYFYDCTFSCTSTNYLFYGWSSHWYHFYNCVFDCSNWGVGDYIFYSGGTGVNYALFESCDLTNAGGTDFYYIKDLWDDNVRYELRNCRLPASWAGFCGGTIEATDWGLLEGCYSGTIDESHAWKHYWQTYAGTVASDDTRYRTGGASDGESSYCWAFTGNSSCSVRFRLESRPIVRWVEAGSQTLTLYLAMGSSYEKDQIWAVLDSPNESDSYANHKQQSSMDLDGGALTTDGSSSWSGTGVGTLRTISFSINPVEPGMVSLRVFCADNITFYVDPIIESSLD